jgi:streptogramin lyase
MKDLHSEIRAAFEKEQAAFPAHPALRQDVARVLAAIQSAGDAARLPNRPKLEWLPAATAILIALAIVAGLVASRLGHRAPTPALPLCTAGVTITEYKMPIADPTMHSPGHITSGPDGNLWFVESAGNRVAKMTPSGVFTEYEIPTPNSLPLGIAAGPDGNVWFTERYGNKVAKVTGAGIITEYPLPNSGPWGIVAGPDGNLWVAELEGHKVAKVTTSGAITEYSTPTALSGPFEIAVGPDGNLWFTEHHANKVAKVTTSGVFTEYPISLNYSGVSVIAAGPDGNLWFGADNMQSVAKITTGGVVTTYPIPGPRVLGMATGPDGNLWLAENNRVARVTSSGHFNEYPIPSTNSGAFSITAGHDGNLWFTETYKVAKLDPRRVCPASAARLMTPLYSPPTYNSPVPTSGGWVTYINHGGHFTFSAPADWPVSSCDGSSTGYFVAEPGGASCSRGENYGAWLVGLSGPGDQREALPPNGYQNFYFGRLTGTSEAVVDGVHGLRYTAKIDKNGLIGTPKGTDQIFYVFFNGERTYAFNYYHLPQDPDRSADFERLIQKTLRFSAT